nr:general transcription factor 3C polypeptide 6 isoform X2 [Helicoverpa armigera]
MNEEVTDSEEEFSVYAELEDAVNIEKYRSVHVLGVNGKNPIIQMDDTFFTGKYENALGTYMFFEEDLDAKSEDPLFDKLPEKNLKYVCKTRKLLSMEHAYVTPKEGHDLQNPKQEVDESIEPVNFETLQEAIDNFKTRFESESVSEVTES